MLCLRCFIAAFLLLGGWTRVGQGEIHSLNLLNDERPVIALSEFGLLAGGYLKVNVTNLQFSGTDQFKIGFVLDRSDSVGSAGDAVQDNADQGCFLGKTPSDSSRNDNGLAAVMNIVPDHQKPGKYQLEIKSKWGVRFYSADDFIKWDPTINQTEDAMSTIRGRGGYKIVNGVRYNEEYRSKPYNMLPINGNFNRMDFAFYMQIEWVDQIGLYSLYFHKCGISKMNYHKPSQSRQRVNFTAQITEKNSKSYLSAGDAMLPVIYGVMSLAFFAVGIIWIGTICTESKRVLTIHRLMAVEIFVKALTVMSHSLYYYFISKDGLSESWPVIYYAFHTFEGVLFFTCLVLIGTGWGFIKYALTSRENLIFVAIILLQIVNNVAYAVSNLAEEGTESYARWNDVALLIDLVCCGIVLVPVVLSRKHLQKLSKTDGGSQKREAFKLFWIVIVLYLYLTRIAAYLLLLTLPFQYIWIHNLFLEVISFAFLSVTGYKFRPGCFDNYTRLIQEDNDTKAIQQSAVKDDSSIITRQTNGLSQSDHT